MIALLRASYEGWHGERSEAVWQWKFVENPHGEARIWVGDDEGRIAGCYILTPVMMQVARETVRGAQSVDAAVSPDYRGRGVFTDLAKAALQDAAAAGIALVFAFPSEGAFGGQIRVGYKPQLVVPKAYRPLVWAPRQQRFHDLSLSEAGAFDARFDVFCGQGGDHEISPHRDPAYLNWRYFAHPTHGYDVITCERGSEICGYCVLKVRETRRLAVGYVVDLQVLPDSGSAARFLAHHALLRLRSKGARLAVSWERPPGQVQEAMGSCGFSPRYASIRQRLRRTRYVDQLIAFDGDEDRLVESESGARLDGSLRWSLVPGDADYV